MKLVRPPTPPSSSPTPSLAELVDLEAARTAKRAAIKAKRIADRRCISLDVPTNACLDVAAAELDRPASWIIRQALKIALPVMLANHRRAVAQADGSGDE